MANQWRKYADKMYTIVMTKNEWNLTIKRSKRRSVSLQCLHDGKLVVRAPLCMGKREILDFVESKKTWIERNRNYLKECQDLEKDLNLADGRQFPFLGKDFKVRRIADAETQVLVDYDERIFDIAALDDEIAIKSMLTFIRQSAEAYLPVRTDKLATRMQLSYKVLRIKDQKSRWGSCSNRGNLNLNARIMFAPPEVIDYLIIHELAHLVHLNHSGAFYRLVEEYSPSYRNHQRWLKEHGYLLRWGRN